MRAPLWLYPSGTRVIDQTLTMPAPGAELIPAAPAAMIGDGATFVPAQHSTIVAAQAVMPVQMSEVIVVESGMRFFVSVAGGGSAILRRRRSG